MRRKTTVGQKMPQDVIPKLVGFILYVRALRVKHSYQLSNMFAMDETACWLNMPAPTTLEKTGAIEVPIHSTGHDKSRFTVCLTAKADGSKCKPLIVFKGKRIDKELTKVTGVIIKMASNGWMNEELTQQYLSDVIGPLAFQRRLLIWDTYRCHISKAVKEKMKKLKIDMAAIPGGCTGLIQAADVLVEQALQRGIS
jgi:hypothetical protein